MMTRNTAQKTLEMVGRIPEISLLHPYNVGPDQNGIKVGIGIWHRSCGNLRELRLEVATILAETRHGRRVLGRDQHYNPILSDRVGEQRCG